MIGLISSLCLKNRAQTLLTPQRSQIGFSERPVGAVYQTARLLESFFSRKQPSIGDCRLPIADWPHRDTAIRNRQFAIVRPHS